MQSHRHGINRKRSRGAFRKPYPCRILNRRCFAPNSRSSPQMDSEPSHEKESSFYLVRHLLERFAMEDRTQRAASAAKILAMPAQSLKRSLGNISWSHSVLCLWLAREYVKLHGGVLFSPGGRASDVPGTPGLANNTRLQLGFSSMSSISLFA